MSIKTKTTTVAALAALTLPSAALAHGGDKGKHRGHHGGHGGVVLAGTDVSGLAVTDGKLTGPLTLDPVFASRKALRTFGLTREKVKSEETIQVGAAGDDVRVKYKGLEATDAIAPTDVISIQAKKNRETGALDIRKIVIWRKK